MDVFGYLESQRYRYGLDTADIWNGFLPTTDESYLRKVKDEMDARGLTLVNLAVDGAHIWDADESVRLHLRERALAHLRAASVLGARSVRIDMGGQDDQMTSEQFDEVVARYQEYAQIASDWGFRVGPENHFGPSLVPGNLTRVADAVAHPAYGILLHMGRFTQERERGDELCAPWAMHVHLDARTIEQDLESRMHVLMSTIYAGCWGIETGEGSHEYENVAWGIAAVKRVLSHVHVTPL